MKRLIFAVAALFLAVGSVSAQPAPFAPGARAKDIRVDTAALGTNLGTTNNTVQKVIDTLDELTLGGEFNATRQGNLVWGNASLGIMNWTFNITAGDSVLRVGNGAWVIDDATLETDGFAGSGAALATLNGSNISSGTVADARIAATLLRTTGSGAALTNLNGDNISSGTVADARIANTLLRTTGSGAALTNLNGDNISSGTVADARIADTLLRTTGSAAAVTSINGSNISSGTVAAARMHSSVILEGDSGASLTNLNGANLSTVPIAQGGTGTTSLDNLIALTDNTTGNYVASVADGTGIDGTAAGEGATYTPTFDATELGVLTWGAGSLDILNWTINVVDGDTTIRWGNATMSIEGASASVQAGYLFSVASGEYVYQGASNDYRIATEGTDRVIITSGGLALQTGAYSGNANGLSLKNQTFGIGMDDLNETGVYLGGPLSKASTITKLGVARTSGTSVTVTVMECNSTGGACVNSNATIAVSAAYGSTASFTDAAFDAGDYWAINVTAITGPCNGSIVVTYDEN